MECSGEVLRGIEDGDDDGEEIFAREWLLLNLVYRRLEKDKCQVCRSHHQSIWDPSNPDGIGPVLLDRARHRRGCHLVPGLVTPGFLVSAEISLYRAQSETDGLHEGTEGCSLRLQWQ